MSTAAGTSGLSSEHPAAAAERSVLRRAAPSIVAGGVLAILLIRLAFDAGGYFPASYLNAGAIALIVCAAILVLAPPHYRLSTEALTALAALGGLALWTGLSSLWSPAPSAAIEAMQRDIAYLGLLGLGLVAAGSGRYSRHLVWLALGVVCVICGAGLIARLYPDLISDPQNDFALFRLSYPLTYWNALGALAAVGAVLAIGLSADPRTQWVLRGAAGSAAVLLVTTMALTQSRGAWAALFAGLVVLVLFGAHRGSLVFAGGIVGLGCVLALGRLSSYPALTDNPAAAAGQESAGHAFGPQLLLVVIAVGVALAVIGLARASAELMDALARVGRPLLLAIAVPLAVVVMGGYLARAADVEGRAAGKLTSVSDWVERQWDDFMAPASPQAPVAGDQTNRVTGGAGGSRSDVYRIALNGFSSNPLAGDGGGSFRVRWMAERPYEETLINAHSLEIETLSEYGLIGVLLLGAFIGAIGFAAVRSRLKPGGLARSQTAAVAGACTVWVVHSAVDWDWQMTSLTGVVLLLACTLFPYGRRREPRRRRDDAGELEPAPQV